MKLQELEPKARSFSQRKDVRQALEKVRKQNNDGLLLPEEVVSEAQSEDSPLHRAFEWDDTKAGRQYRLMQARALIRHIEVVYPDDKSEQAIPKYVSLKSDRRRPGGGYRETGQVLSSKELLKELEDTAKKELESWTQRYKMLNDLCEKVRKAAGLKVK